MRRGWLRRGGVRVTNVVANPGMTPVGPVIKVAMLKEVVRESPKEAAGERWPL